MVRDSILAIKVFPSPGVFPSGVLVYFRRTLFPGLNMGNKIFLGSAVFSPVISVLCLSPSAFSSLLPLFFLRTQLDMEL